MPAGLIGMLVLVAIIESAIARRWLDFSDPVSLSWQFADRAARADAPGRDVLFLGDSLVKHGLIPSVFERESGLRGVNLAAARAPALMSYFVLRRALESGARPSSIVINTKPAVLIGGVDYNAHYWPAALSAPECLELGRIAGKGTLGVAAMTARLIPTLQARLEIRAGLSAALGDSDDPIPMINRTLWRNWSINDGANVATMESEYRGALSADLAEKLHPDRWYVDRSNRIGVEKLLDLAASRRILVYWLLPPISPGLQEWRERSGSESKYEGFVRSYQARHPGVVTVLDARRVARDPTLYVDATHLSGHGGVVLSRSVAAAIKAGPRRDGWTVLADPAPGDAPRLEDVEESKRIVRGAR